MEWFNALEPVLKIYWTIALAASLVFVVQMIMTFAGADVPDGLDADAEPSQFFSLRNLVNFLLGFGWGGVCFYNTFSSRAWVTACALLTGVVFVVLFFFLVRQFMKLNRDNTFNINDTLNLTADVYLPIPSEKSGKGKIQLSVNGSFHELDAITSGDRIPTGSRVRITEIIDNQTILVTKL
jgi:hypothetical protein